MLPVSVFPSCWSVNSIVPLPTKNAGSPVAPPGPAIGLHKPVMPGPIGTSRSQTATCGRSATCFAAIVTLAEVSPGDVASTVMLPAVFAD